MVCDAAGVAGWAMPSTGWSRPEAVFAAPVKQPFSIRVEAEHLAFQLGCVLRNKLSLLRTPIATQHVSMTARDAIHGERVACPSTAAFLSARPIGFRHLGHSLRTLQAMGSEKARLWQRTSRGVV